jgi:hypothetical protein
VHVSEAPRPGAGGCVHWPSLYVRRLSSVCTGSPLCAHALLFVRMLSFMCACSPLCAQAALASPSHAACVHRLPLRLPPTPPVCTGCPCVSLPSRLCAHAALASPSHAACVHRLPLRLPPTPPVCTGCPCVSLACSPLCCPCVSLPRRPVTVPAQVSDGGVGGVGGPAGKGDALLCVCTGSPVCAQVLLYLCTFFMCGILCVHILFVWDFMCARYVCTFFMCGTLCVHVMCARFLCVGLCVCTGSAHV